MAETFRPAVLHQRALLKLTLGMVMKKLCCSYQGEEREHPASLPSPLDVQLHKPLAWQDLKKHKPQHTNSQSPLKAAEQVKC